MGYLTDEILQETLDAVEKYGNPKKAARELKIPSTTFTHRYKRAIERFKYNIPDGQKLHKLTMQNKILPNGDRVPTQEWVKTNIDLERQLEMLETAVKALNKDIKPVKKTPKPKTNNDDLLSTYIITDYHIGCLSLKAETIGRDWNIQIAEDLLVSWFEEAISTAPDSHTAIFAQLGDFLHYDGLTAVTPTSGHVLDADSRFQFMVEVAMRSIKRIVEMLLKKHEHVHILMCEGNHDISSSVWLRAVFKMLYSNEPRVTVDDTKLPFYAYEWGLTSLFYHHGHKVKMGRISEVFASIFRDVFGRTKYSYVHTGHYHHKMVKENSMMIIEQHQTLAPSDSYSARLGLSSNSGACRIDYSKKFGEKSRVVIRPEMVL